MDWQELQRRQVIASLTTIRQGQRDQNAPIGHRPKNRPIRGLPLCWSKDALPLASILESLWGICELDDRLVQP